MRKIAILLLLSLVLASCNSEEKVEIKKNYKTVEVWTWMVNTSNNFIGYTKWVSQAMLATKSPGRITYMWKKVWDKVFAWELLASLDSSEAKSWYNTTNKIVNNLYSIRDKTAKAFDEQIKAMEAKIESVKAQVVWVSTGLEDTKNITEKQLETAKTNLEKTKKELETKKENILSWAKSSLTYTKIIWVNSMDFVEYLLWMDKNNDDFNNKIDEYLWKKDSNQLKSTEELYKNILAIYNDYKDFYNNKIEGKNPTEETLIEWLNKADNLLSKLSKLLDETYIVVWNSIENIYFSGTMISDLKNQITNLWTKVEQTILSTEWWQMIWVKWSLENLKNFESQKQKAISLLEKQVEQYEAMALWQVNDVTTKKKLASLWLEEAQAWLQALIAQKDATLREVDTKITEAIGQRDNASIMISNWNIIAPFSWIVTNKMSEVGQITNAWMPLYEIADNRKIKLKISVPVSIISNLKTWEKLDVNIESLNKTFVWVITNISLSANPITKKYEVELTLNNKKWQIPVWEMAIVSFNTDFLNNGPHPTSPLKGEEQEQLRIPNSAIIEKFMTPWVYILENNVVKFKKIKITKMWEFYSEIEGLELSQKIITDWKENILPWEVLK